MTRQPSCIRLQRYKTFESNSQHGSTLDLLLFAVSDCKDTKLLKAIHNFRLVFEITLIAVSDCKDTKLLKAIHNRDLVPEHEWFAVSDCKDTKLLKAIHNGKR